MLKVPILEFYQTFPTEAMMSEFLVQGVKAPFWADYAAINKDGLWFWFGEEPRPSGRGWITGSVQNPNVFNVEMFDGGDYEGLWWFESLQTRPDLVNLKKKIQALENVVEERRKKSSELYEEANQCSQAADRKYKEIETLRKSL